jgi:NADPH:quinone reductase-like Zn-dependent oxidoreductase
MLVIQLAALSGLEVITTASLRHTDLLKSFGAKHVLDYNSPTVVEDISRLTHGRLEYIYDCISTAGSTQTAVKCLSGAGGKVVTLLPVDPSTLGKNVELHVIALFKLTGKGFPFGGRQFPPSPEDKEWFEQRCNKLSKLTLSGKLKGNPIKVMGGLDAVSEGFQYMEDGKVHGEKLVYEVAKE